MIELAIVEFLQAAIQRCLDGKVYNHELCTDDFGLRWYMNVPWILTTPFDAPEDI